MNFVLKSTDVFEKSDKADDHNVRLVDAKFALPKGPDEPSREYVSLDLPDYPSEHDDVIVGFSDEAGRPWLPDLLLLLLMLTFWQSVINLLLRCQQPWARHQNWHL